MNYFDKCKIKFIIDTLQIPNIDDNSYFKMNYISNSKLKLINPTEGGSPELYKQGLKFKYDPSLDFGSAVHQLFLEKDDFKLSSYKGKPSAKLGLFIDEIFKNRKYKLSIYDSIIKASDKSDYFKTIISKIKKSDKNIFKNNKTLNSAFKKGIEYYLKKLHGDFSDPNKNVIVLSENVRDNCIKSLKSLNDNYSISNLFEDNMFIPKIYLNEFTILINILVTLPDKKVIELPFKAKLDNIIIDPEKNIIYLNDLKTTSKPSSFFMGNFTSNVISKDAWINGSFQKYHYYRQMGIYMYLTMLMINKYYPEYSKFSYKSNMIVVESINEHNSFLFPVSNSYIKEGLREFKELICRVAFHEINGYDNKLNEDGL